QAAPALFEVRAGHALLAGVDLERIPPRRGRGLFGGQPLARGAPGPLLAATPGWVALGFDPDGCVLASSAAYPLLLRNAVALLGRSRTPARPEFFVVGEVAGERRLLGPPGFWETGDATLALNLLVPELDRPRALPLAAAAAVLLAVAWWLFWRAR
ncbi:MAG: hypothetical protein ACE5JG_08875, partial [Planctomycetota bacterium]